MRLIAYLFFYLFFIFLESISFLTSSFLIKFDILIPVIIYSVTLGSLGSFFFSVFFALITGLSQGFIMININFALLMYFLISACKKTFQISSKEFMIISTTLLLFCKAFFLFLFNSKSIKIDLYAFSHILIFSLVNGLLSFYIYSLARYLTKLTLNRL